MIKQDTFTMRLMWSFILINRQCQARRLRWNEYFSE